MENKLSSALVVDQFLKAYELAEYLKVRGIRPKVVQRFAVQIAPAEIERAEAAMKVYRKDWRGDKRYWRKDEDHSVDGGEHQEAESRGDSA